jgi:hypothetical protein
MGVAGCGVVAADARGGFLLEPEFTTLLCGTEHSGLERDEGMTLLSTGIEE